jgi:hypothetical protein
MSQATIAMLAQLASSPSEANKRDGTMSDGSVSVDSIEADKSKARLMKLERVKKKLRDRDSRLSVLARDNNRSLLSGDIKPYEARHGSGSDDDSKEAVRVLSYAAFKLQRQVDKKTDEAQSLRQSVCELEETLKAKDEENSALTTDMKIFRRSLETYSDQIDRLTSELETKNKEMETLTEEHYHYMKQAQECKGKLDASRKDYEWMRKESMAKSEQIEYFEYELLAKNDEIDKLHQEIDQKLRRIAELEVDLELVDTRTSHVLEKSEKSLVASRDYGTVRPRSATTVNPADDGNKHQITPKRIALFRLRELKCQSKAEDPEAFARMLKETLSGEESINNGSFPTDRSTDTTAVVSSITGFTDGSSPPRPRRPSGRRNYKNSNSATEQYIDAIDELRSDLRSVEEKYKQDRYDSTKLIEKLRQENNEYLIKLVCMDCKARNNDEHGASLSLLLDDLNDSVENTSMFDGSAASTETPFESKVNMLKKNSLLTTGSKLPNKTEYLQRKVESMEGERLVNERTIEDLKMKLAELEKFATNRAKSDKRTIDDLVFQNEAQAMKIAQLEQKSRFSAYSDSDEEPEYTTRLEDKVEKQSVDIEKLQLENELKDRTIEALRAQLVDQRVRQFNTTV